MICFGRFGIYLYQNNSCNRYPLAFFGKRQSIRLISTTHLRDELASICATGEIPAKFNFARDVFDVHAKQRPDSIALWFDNGKISTKWTFSQVRMESIRAAIALQKILKTSQWDINNASMTPYMLTILPRIPQWWFLHLGSIRIGTIFCPGTTMLTTEDIEYRLEASAAQMIITDAANMVKVNEAQKVNHRLEKVKKVVVGLVKPEGNWISFDKLVDDVSKEEIQDFKDVNSNSESVAQAFFTSGTTGKPKMVAHTHASYGIGHYKTAKLINLTPDDVHWNISDPGWAKSSYSNFYAPWIAGSTVYIHQMERFEARPVLEALCTQPITTFCGPPTLYRAMVQEKHPNLFKFAAIRLCCGAGEAVNPEVARKWKEKTGVPLKEFYGQTETTGMGGDGISASKEGSFGIPNEGYDIRIVDDNGNECPKCTEGHLAVKVKPTRPVGLFHGYLKSGPNGPELDIDKNSSCFIGDFYITGDRAYMDNDGYVFYVSRTDDVINSAGYRIGPFEVESVLQTHPAVVESAVVASPDPDRGEVVKAFIVLAESHKSADHKKLSKEIQEHCKKHTAPYKYPRKISFINALPKTVSGKILRRELKKQEFSNAG